MRSIRTLGITTGLSLLLVACQTTGPTKLPNGNLVYNNYGYPDIEYTKQNTDRIVYVANGVFVPNKPNGAGVAILGPCPGIQRFNEADTRELAQFFLSKGFIVAVPNYNTSPRPNKRPFNCGKDKNLSDMRLVKDVYDATAELARAGARPDRIFTVGQSLGAQIGADSINSYNARLAKEKKWGPLPRAVIGLYGGCEYPTKTYLDTNIVRPVLWMAGEKDTFSYTEYGCKSWTQSSILKKQPDSKFIVYKDATHCFDCKQLDGFTNKRENQTYRYNAKATQQSREEILKFIEKFK